MAPPDHRVNPDQFPKPGQLFLDHAAIFVDEFEASGARLERLGFTLTPLQAHRSALRPGEPLAALGTGNRCAMLRVGFLEVLGAVGDTPMALQLRRQLARYPGLHLIAFSGADADAHHAALAADGLEPLPIAEIRRTQASPDGEHEVRGRIIRLAPERWPEGRVQIVFPQMSPEALWHPSLVRHANAADRLSEMLVVTAEPAGRAGVFARFTRRPQAVADDRHVLQTERGRVHLIAPAAVDRYLPGARPPSLPWIAAVAIGSADLDRTAGHLRQAGIRTLAHRGTLQVPPDEALGATLVFHDRADDRVFEAIANGR